MGIELPNVKDKVYYQIQTDEFGQPVGAKLIQKPEIIRLAEIEARTQIKIARIKGDSFVFGVCFACLFGLIGLTFYLATRPNTDQLPIRYQEKVGVQNGGY